MRGRPKADLVVTAQERKELVALTQRRKTSQALAQRARIVLACAEGLDNQVVAAREHVKPQTVGKWRTRFVAGRLEGLQDAPRTGTPRTVDDASVEALVIKTLQENPNGATHWSVRTMARDANMASTTVF